MVLLICVLLLGMLLAGPVTKGFQAMTRVVGHFLMVALVLVVVYLAASALIR